MDAVQSIWDTRKIEFDGVQKALLDEERKRFNQIIEICKERLKWDNTHAHTEEAHRIIVLANDIKALHARRETLVKEYEQAKHS